jgi:hypothetical protein
MRNMPDIHDIISELERYAKAKGTTPASVCRAATKNPRMLDRLKRRAKRVETEIETIRRYMAENPVARAAE